MARSRQSTSNLERELALAASLRPERADRLRRRVVSAVRAYFDCAAAVYIGFAAMDDDIVCTSVTAASSDEGGTFGHYEGAPLPLELELVRHPVERGSAEFRYTGALLGFRQSVTVVFFDGPVAVGCLAALFSRGRPQPALITALNEALPSVRRLALRAAQLEDQELGADTRGEVFIEADGRVEVGGEAVGTWPDARRRVRLEARLEAALAGRGSMDFVLDGAWVSCERCEPSALGPRARVTMRAAPRPRLPRDHALTQRQRRLCLLIAEGTPLAGAARALGVSEKTAAKHLHHAYAALGVSQPEQLRHALREAEAERPFEPARQATSGEARMPARVPSTG